MARLVAAAGTGAIEKAARDNEQLAAGIATLRRAFTAARDLDQIEQLDKELTRLKDPVDLARHFGFIARWRAIGPFDNRKGIGFEAVYPPEEDRRLSAAHYPGKKARSLVAQLTPPAIGRAKSI